MEYLTTLQKLFGVEMLSRAVLVFERSSVVGPVNGIGICGSA